MKDDKARIQKRLASLRNAPPPTVLPPQKAAKKDRGAERRLTYRLAVIKFPGGERINCVIKNLSAKGAKVVIEGASVVLKAKVEIEQGNHSVKAQVIWQEENEIGLAFI